MPHTFRSAVLVAAALTVAVSGQDPPPQPTFRTEANYVRVDVYPTQNDVPVADLTQADFEVLDNGTPQKIEQFERVVVRAAGPQEARIEPNTVRESRAMLENSRSRVFVVFLDVYHVGVEGSHNIRKPLVDALDRVIGADDLVGVMTPEMSARDIAFARKTTTIEGMLTRHWYWGERGQLISKDPEEDQYWACYPGTGPNATCADDDRGIASELIQRRREKRTMDAMEDLVRYLRGVREERKAVLTITDGWLLFRRNPALARRLYCRVPTGPEVGVDPRTGRLTTGDRNQRGYYDTSDCDRDRLQLSEIDDDEQFRRMLDEANRSNVSFYPIDPRGLPVFDTSIYPQELRSSLAGAAPVVPLATDAAMLRGRLTSLRTLAEATDGLAVVNSNDLARGLKRVVDDLTSYYLLGYYASSKLDGKFHSITVRVKRPGVSVRARRGYLAASEADMVATARATTRANEAVAAAPGAAAEARAIDLALAPLEGYARPLPVRMHAVAGWKPGNTAGVWVVGEVSAGAEWRGGAQGEITLMNGAGTIVASGRASIEPGARSFRAPLTPDQPLAAGDYTIRLRLRGFDSTTSSADTLRIALPEGPDATGAVFIRRTGTRDAPTADLRFRRSEQLRVELPTPGSAALTARLLDRTGKALGVPVTNAVRDDPDGSRWQMAQVALAPLAPADYLIEISSDGKRTLLGFRVIP